MELKLRVCEGCNAPWLQQPEDGAGVCRSCRFQALREALALEPVPGDLEPRIELRGLVRRTA